MANQTSSANLGFTPERYPHGVHVCLMYNDEVGRRSVIYPYVRAGLQENEDVAYFADALVTEHLERALDPRSAASLPREQLNRLRITSVEDTYFPTGTFEPEAMIDNLRGIYEASRHDGASGARVCGETGWAARGVPGSASLVRLESEINALVRTTPLTAMCQYDTEQFDGDWLFDIFSVHPLMVVGGQLIRNPCYVEPEEFDRHGARPTDLSLESVLARLFLAQLVVHSLPDEQRVAEFVRCAIGQVPGVKEVRICLAGTVVPPDERFESVARRVERASTRPNEFDVAAVERETEDVVFVLRTTTRLFGVVLIDVADEVAFAPYHDVLDNLANAVAMTLDARRREVESRAWPERIATLEHRLTRIAHELEGAGVLASSSIAQDPYLLPGVSELSPRQWEVFARLVRGERVPRIANELFLSRSTVRNHLADVFRKMGVHSQEELLDLFRERTFE